MRALTAEEVREAHRKVCRSADAALPIDFTAIRALVAHHNLMFAQLPRLSQADRPETVELITSHLLATTASLRTMPDAWLDTIFACHVAEAWLIANGWVLDRCRENTTWLHSWLSEVPNPVAKVSEAVLDSVRGWVRGHLVQQGCASPGHGHCLPLPQQVNAFLACPLTAQSPAELEQSVSISQSAAEALSSLGVASYQVVLHSGAMYDRRRAESPEQRLIDEHRIAQTDLVVLYAPRPATGLGVISAKAARYGAKVIVIRGDARLSPMLRGESSQPAIFWDDEFVSQRVYAHAHALLPDLLERAERRELERPGNAAELSLLLEDLEASSDVDLRDSPRLTMTAERYRELISSPYIWAARSVDEDRQLQHLVPRLPALSSGARQALASAARFAGWSEIIVRSLAVEGRRAQALGGKQRLQQEQPGYWHELYDRMERACDD